MASLIQLKVIQKLVSDGWEVVSSKFPPIVGGPILMKKSELGNMIYIIIAPNGDQETPTSEQVRNF